ncbi:tetratricopeptide repeat protein [Sphingomonas sp. NSE70-1]|uniref:Tetratricopeptide repeat protein n=1 Tax=Sphingomonas caseinilyticus TaxID=2908205 RepID=A0ABT0RR95_9SPHN|nr:tetratricopeptide repeat protein [Sphingomonas caseinilyticus]MCL6697542.1 tetratricopeptide repeat protein [Sphingomonas caseinilyticus]
MKLNPTAFALLLAAGGLVTTAPAVAQDKKDEAAAAPKQPQISSGARKEIVALQAAVNAKDAAAIPAAVAAAQAKAKNKDDHFVIAQLQLKAAVDAKDNAATLTALQAVLNSGYLSPAETLPLYMNLGQLHYNAKNFDPAAAAFEQVLKIDPNHLEATVMLGETRNGQGRAAEAVTLIEKAIAAKTASGQKADESWYKRSVALAFNAKLPNAPELSRKWVAAYPSPKTWRDTIRIYQTSSQLDDSGLIDTMRLAQATGALAGENDYFRFANTLVTKGFAGEAKMVLEQGFAANSIDKNKATFSQLYSLASTKSQGDRATLDGSAKTALAAPAARQAMVTAEAYYGYGDYQKSADLFRAALDKQGVDKDVANLRLGMALARAGDKAGATSALNAVGGTQAEIAKLWLAYVATKA